MAEDTLVGYVQKGLKKQHLHVCKHNDITPGISDISAFDKVSGKTFWVELKAVPEWPKKSGTPVRLTKFTEEQAVFLRRRHGWLFVRIARMYFLFDDKAAWKIWQDKGILPEDAVMRSRLNFNREVDWEQMTEVMRNET